ncbi:MAG: LysR family transcriptional regulator [Candidatus Binataceae bacterium]
MQRRNPNIESRHNIVQQLRGFCYAAQAESISRAAERMSLTQPSVSLQVQMLERELGVTLFARRGRQIKLTPEGQMLLDLALPLIERFEALPKTFAEARGEVNRGAVDIAAGESTLLYLLPPFVNRYSKSYPEIRFRLHNVTGRDGLAMLRADKADFAVGSMLDIPDDVAYRPIFSYETVLITAPGHPLAANPKPSLRDVSRYGLILPPRHLSTWRMVRLVFGQHNLECRVTFEAGGWEVIKKYVELGLGISIVTSICLTGGENLHVAPLGHYFPDRTYGIVIRRNKFLSPQANAFVSMMEADKARVAAARNQPATPLKRRFHREAGKNARAAEIAGASRKSGRTTAVPLVNLGGEDEIG